MANADYIRISSKMTSASEAPFTVTMEGIYWIDSYGKRRISMKLSAGTIILLCGLGAAIAGVVKLSGDAIGLGLLLGGIAAVYVALKIFGVKL